MESKKQRLDQALVAHGLAPTRSQAQGVIRLGKVTLNGQVITKPGFFVGPAATIKMAEGEQYVSRAGLKLASVALALGLDFKDKIVLDVGSSTGGFTDYALRRGAKRVIAVDVGTKQMHPSLRHDSRVDVREQTDIRDVPALPQLPGIVVIDVSFISLRDILPHVARLSGPRTAIVAMCKPQFEAGSGNKHKGVIKNDAMRRDILRNFELWAKNVFVIKDKADSQIPGAKGNQERFYLLNKLVR